MHFDVNKIIRRIDEIGMKEYNRRMSEGEKRAFSDYIFEAAMRNTTYRLMISGLTDGYAKKYFEKAVFMYFNKPPVGQSKFYWKEGEIYRACVSF